MPLQAVPWNFNLPESNLPFPFVGGGGGKGNRKILGIGDLSARAQWGQ